jgi:hypothetical protein
MYSPLPIFASRTIPDLPMIFHVVGVDESAERPSFARELEAICSF